MSTAGAAWTLEQENERLRAALVAAYALWSKDQCGCETASQMADVIHAVLEPEPVPQPDEQKA